MFSTYVEWGSLCCVVALVVFALFSLICSAWRDEEVDEGATRENSALAVSSADTTFCSAAGNSRRRLSLVQWARQTERQHTLGWEGREEMASRQTHNCSHWLAQRQWWRSMRDALSFGRSIASCASNSLQPLHPMVVIETNSSKD